MPNEEFKKSTKIIIILDQNNKPTAYRYVTPTDRACIVRDAVGCPVACGVVTPTDRAFIGRDALGRPVALDTASMLVGDLYLYRRAWDALDGLWAYDRETDTVGRAYAGPGSGQPPYTSPNFAKQYIAYDRFSKFLFLGNSIYGPSEGQSGSPNLPHDGDWVVRRLGNDVYAIDTRDTFYEAGAYSTVDAGAIDGPPIYRIAGWSETSAWEGHFNWERTPAGDLDAKLADLYAGWNTPPEQGGPYPFQFRFYDIGAGPSGEIFVSGIIPDQWGWAPEGNLFWQDVTNDIYYYFESNLSYNIDNATGETNNLEFLQMSARNAVDRHASHGTMVFADAKDGEGRKYVFDRYGGVSPFPAAPIPQAQTIPVSTGILSFVEAGGVIRGASAIGQARPEVGTAENFRADFVEYDPMQHTPSSRVWRAGSDSAVIFRDAAGAYFSSDLHGVYIPESIDVGVHDAIDPVVEPTAYTWRLGFGKPGVVTNFHGTHASIGALASAWPTPDGDGDAAVADVAGTVAHWINGAWTLTTIDTPPEFSSNLYMEEGEGKSVPFTPGPPPFLPCPLCFGAVISITLDWPSTYTGSVQWLPVDPCDTTDTTRAAWTRGQKKYMCLADADAYCDAASYYRQIDWGTGDTIYIYSETDTVHAVNLQGPIFDGFDQYLDNTPTGHIAYPLTFATPISGALGGEEFTVTIDLERGDITSC